VRGWLADPRLQPELGNPWALEFLDHLPGYRVGSAHGRGRLVQVMAAKALSGRCTGRATRRKRPRLPRHRRSGRWLRSVGLHSLYSSPMRRAWQTAEGIAPLWRAWKSAWMPDCANAWIGPAELSRTSCHAGRRRSRFPADLQAW